MAIFFRQSRRCGSFEKSCDKIAQPDGLALLTICSNDRRKSWGRAHLTNAGEFNRRYLTCQISAIKYADRGDRRKSQSLQRTHLAIFADRGNRRIKSPGVSLALSNDDENGNENDTRKYIFISCVLLRNYFNSLNFYKNGELSRNQIGRSGVQVKKENEKFAVVLSRSLQNLKCGHFKLLFCGERQRNVLKCKTHVQSDCFCTLNLLFCGVVVAVTVVVA